MAHRRVCRQRRWRRLRDARTFHPWNEQTLPEGPPKLRFGGRVDRTAPGAVGFPT
jgi:hypothetical protein